MFFNAKFALFAFAAVAVAQSSSSASSASGSASGSASQASASGGATPSGSGAGSVPSGLGLTPCILDCVTAAAMDAKCNGFADLPCVCTSQAFQSEANGCLQNNCTPADIATAQGLQKSQCGSMSPSGSGAAGSGSATSPAPTAASTTGSQPAATTTNAATGLAAGGVWAFAAGLLGVAAAI